VLFTNEKISTNQSRLKSSRTNVLPLFCPQLLSRSLFSYLSLHYRIIHLTQTLHYFFSSTSVRYCYYCFCHRHDKASINEKHFHLHRHVEYRGGLGRNGGKGVNFCRRFTSSESNHTTRHPLGLHRLRNYQGLPTNQDGVTQSPQDILFDSIDLENVQRIQKQLPPRRGARSRWASQCWIQKILAVFRMTNVLQPTIIPSQNPQYKDRLPTSFLLVSLNFSKLSEI
jgi:hypothetical protein